MKTPLAFLVVLAAAVALPAAETRREVTNATTPELDGKPNSSAVPDVYAVDGRIERVVILRFKFDSDLLEGLTRMVKEKGIRNGVILSGIGSVRGYHIHQVSNRTFPSKNIFVKDPDAPADIIGMSGYVMNGKVHPHITLATDKHSLGGHLEPDTRVFTFAIVTIGVLPDALDLTKLDDKTYR